MEMEKWKLEAREKSTNEGIVNIGSSMLPFGDDSDGVGRSYECSFCKRGFTNAQALGGHMNIHRKDKLAKSGQPSNYNASSSSYSFPTTNYMAPHEDHHHLYHPHHHHHHSSSNNQNNSSNYYTARTGLPSPCNALGPQSNYPAVFNYSYPEPPPVPNFSSRSSCPLIGSNNYDASGAHLSLWVGVTRKTEDHNEMTNDGSGEPLDLELRLGRNP